MFSLFIDESDSNSYEEIMGNIFINIIFSYSQYERLKYFYYTYYVYDEIISAIINYYDKYP